MGRLGSSGLNVAQRTAVSALHTSVMTLCGRNVHNEGNLGEGENMFLKIDEAT